MMYSESNKGICNIRLLRELIGALALVVWLFPNVASSQGYYNQESFGNRSILLSGNVVGSVDDLGLTYYNPARLALIDEPNFTINAKGYQYESLKIENVFGRNNKISDSNFRDIPSMVAGTFRVGKSDRHKFAYAILSRRKSNSSLGFSREIEPEKLEEFENVERFVSDLDLRNNESDEWFGVSWSTSLEENFSIGVSTFFSVYNFNGTYDLSYSRLSELDAVALYDNEIHFSQNSYGVFMKVGMAWNLPKASLGLNIDVPLIEVFGSGKMEFKEMLSGISNEDGVFRYAQWEDLKSRRKEPIGVSFGVGLPLGKHTLHLKTDWHGKVSEYDKLEIPIINSSGENVSFAFKEGLRSVINFGMGAEFAVGSKVIIFASGVTDFSPIISNANIFDLIAKESRDINFDADFYHFGLGVQLKTSWSQFVLGGGYSRASINFERPSEFPDSVIETALNDDQAKIIEERWRIILGLEIPIFGKKVEFN